MDLGYAVLQDGTPPPIPTPARRRGSAPLIGGAAATKRIGHDTARGGQAAPACAGKDATQELHTDTGRLFGTWGLAGFSAEDPCILC